MDAEKVWIQVIDRIQDWQKTGDGNVHNLIVSLRVAGYEVSFVPRGQERDFFTKVIEYLNQVAGTQFKPKFPSHNSRLIISRRNEGHNLDDFKKIIDRKTAQWKGTPAEIYLRPETLFSAKHFDNYLGEINRYGTIQQGNQGGFDAFAASIASAAKQAAGDHRDDASDAGAQGPDEDIDHVQL